MPETPIFYHRVAREDPDTHALAEVHKTRGLNPVAHSTADMVCNEHARKEPGVDFVVVDEQDRVVHRARATERTDMDERMEKDGFKLASDTGPGQCPACLAVELRYLLFIRFTAPATHARPATWCARCGRAEW